MEDSWRYILSILTVRCLWLSSSVRGSEPVRVGQRGRRVNALLEASGGDWCSSSESESHPPTWPSQTMCPPARFRCGRARDGEKDRSDAVWTCLSVVTGGDSGRPHSTVSIRPGVQLESPESVSAPQTRCPMCHFWTLLSVCLSSERCYCCIERARRPSRLTPRNAISPVTGAVRVSPLLRPVVAVSVRVPGEPGASPSGRWS